jgi:large subunit ribosomal protein L29
MKTTKELRKLEPNKLTEELKENKKALAKIEFEVKNGSSKNTAERKRHRRQVARINTLAKEHQTNLEKSI